MGHRAGKRLGFLACALSIACGPRPAAERPSDLQRASLGEPATAALVVGCWALAWNLGAAGAASPSGEMPDSVRLRDEVVFGTRERLVAPATHPMGRAGDALGAVPWEARFVLNRWWIEDGELRIRFSDGEREEWDVMLSIDRQELVGSARYSGGREPRGGPIPAGLGAARIACSF